MSSLIKTMIAGQRTSWFFNFLPRIMVLLKFWFFWVIFTKFSTNATPTNLGWITILIIEYKITDLIARSASSLSGRSQLFNALSVVGLNSAWDNSLCVKLIYLQIVVPNLGFCVFIMHAFKSPLHKIYLWSELFFKTKFILDFLIYSVIFCTDYTAIQLVIKFYCSFNQLSIQISFLDTNKYIILLKIK